MRQVKFHIYITEEQQADYGRTDWGWGWLTGFFHGWGFENFNGSLRNVAIIEDQNGVIHEVIPSCIRFIDPPIGKEIEVTK